MILRSGDAGPSTGRSPGQSSTTPVWRAVARSRLLPSKLRPPRLHVALVRRALIDTLVGVDAPLVLLSAPAGSGKTVCLVQWASEDPRPVGWLHVDAADNDPVVFVTGIAAALGPLIELGRPVMELLNLRAPRLRDRVLPCLGAAVAGAPPFVLILDDCQHVRSPECWECVDLLLQHLPDGATLAAASREDPPLPIGRMRAQGDVVVVGMPELALGFEEAKQLLLMHAVSVPGDQLARLLEITEGWVTGVYLALLAGRDSAHPDRLPDVRGDQREIAAYFLAEVLERQPDDVQAFLVETAILDELTTPLCAAVTRRPGAEAMLAGLSRRNLFVTALDEHGEWYRYHHLFAELLRAHLARHEPAVIAELHRRAASWYEDNGHAEPAVRHWLAAGDAGQTVALVERTCDVYLETGRQESARRLLRLFSEEQLLAHPGLAVTAGWVFAACIGTPEEQEHWTHRISSLKVPDEPTADGSPSLLSSLKLLRAELAVDGLSGQLESFRECLPLEPRVGSDWHDAAQQGYGRALWFTGSQRRAERVLRKVLDETEDVLTRAGVGAEVALIAQDAGRWDEAAALVEGARRQVPELGLDLHPGFCSFLPLQLALLPQMTHEGDPGAPRFADEVGEHTERMVHRAPWMRLWAAVMLGEVALEQGDLAEARRRAAEATTIIATYPDAGIFGARTRRLTRALEWRASGDVTPAEARVLGLLPTHLTLPQIAAELFISRNTVKSHLRALYRKLGASSRAEAVMRARELGLL